MKIEIQAFKKSINESAYSPEQIATIWDFYVTKSLSASSSQHRKISDYGYKNIPFDEMMKRAAISDNNIYCLMADLMPKTLASAGLQVIDKKNYPLKIDIAICRVAFIIPYQIIDKGTPRAKTSKADAFMTHIRNAFAHGNTYFFSNGNVLLEDKKGTTTTAMILLKQQTLLDWIALIDKEHRYYSI